MLCRRSYLEVLMKVLALVLALFAFSTADARTIKDDIQALLSDISQEVNVTSAPDATLMSVRDSLAQTLRKLQFGSGGSPRVKLTCTSRDNDGREPYNIAVTDMDRFETTKIPGAVLPKAVCEAAVQGSVSIRDTAFYCASRDADGRDPMALFGYSFSRKSSVKIGIYASFNECLSIIPASRHSRTSFATCVSRDGDARAPFALAVYDLATQAVQKTGNVYSTLNECLSNIP